MATTFNTPAPIRKFFSLFPLHTYQEEAKPPKITSPTLWILPPSSPSSRLSSDVECLKWQAYLALRGISDVQLRWDICPEGGINGVLPTLHLVNGDLLGTQRIPAWGDEIQHTTIDVNEGYQDALTRDESRAWIALLEGPVHSALTVAGHRGPTLKSLISGSTASIPSSLFQPPLPPLSGISTIIPPSGQRIPWASLLFRYREGIEAVSDRLGADEWFLGSSSPTALDALVFAYLHWALQSTSDVKQEVARRRNLVSWEAKVAKFVEASSRAA